MIGAGSILDSGRAGVAFAEIVPKIEGLRGTLGWSRFIQLLDSTSRAALSYTRSRPGVPGAALRSTGDRRRLPWQRSRERPK